MVCHTHWLLFLIAICSLAGCSRKEIPDAIPIRGKVTFQGKPLTEGEILYAPIDETQGRPAVGKIQPDGKFTLRTGSGIEGVIPGDYRVAILAYDADKQNRSPNNSKQKRSHTKSELGSRDRPKPSIPKRYFDAKQSGLTDEVNASHKRYVEFALTE